MKIFRIISLSLLGLFLLVPTCSAWTIDNGVNTGGDGATTAYDPSASPVAGTYTSSQSVTLSASGSSSIRYTVDGSTPSCSSGTVYSSAITVGSTKTVKAIACYADGDGTSASNVATHAYTINVSSGGGGGGGGGGSTTYCSSVTYSDWSASCFGTLQTRSVLTRTPSNCTLTTVQQTDTQRTCQITATSTTPVATTTPDTSTPAATSTPSAGALVLQNIATEAQIMNAQDTNRLMTHLGSSINTAGEQASLTKYATILGLDKTITSEQKMNINDFIYYGTASTQRLGAGERAGVINSYYQAYGRLPNSEAEWSDVLKIASGRWPSERSATAEAQAKLEFKKVYARNAVMTNNIDENAIMVIAYGLLPLNRNLNSEKVAIKTFRWVYGHDPVNALAWNIVRAIAYSGAKR
jgi:hypothetical protein